MERNLGEVMLRYLDPGTGLLHRDDGPASMYVNDDGYAIRKWYRHGSLHRTGGPAALQWFDASNAGTILSWLTDGEPHRDDGPSVVGGDGGLQWRIKGMTLVVAAARQH